MVAFQQIEPQSGSLGKDAKYVADETKRRDWLRNYRLMSHAQRLLFDADLKNRSGENIHRTRICHNARAYQADSISLRIPTDPSRKTANLAGVQTCGSVWACPVCSKRIAMARAKEIGHTIDYMTEAGSIAIMVTCTARHGHQFTLKLFKDKFKAAHRHFVQSQKWRRLKAQFEIQHSIKAVEGTWGIENGWHYHQHAILFLSADALAAAGDDAFNAWIEEARSLWLYSLSKYGLDGIGEIAFDVQADHDVKESYLAKLGLEDETASLDHELSAGHNKTSGGAKIWQILEKSWKGDESYSKLYIEWVEAMSGDQWITFSAGLKALVGLDEIADEDLSFEDIDDELANETLTEISDDEFLPVRKLQKLPELLELAANTRNAEIVKKWLFDLSIDWNNSHRAAELERIQKQHDALEARWQNWRKQINKSQNFPEKGGEFDKLYEQIQQLKRRLELK